MAGKNGGGSAKVHLDLAAIEASLRAVQREFPRINAALRSKRDELSDEVVENMMAGYAFLDKIIVEGKSLMASGNSSRLLELNNLVLCGAGDKKREQYAKHIKATHKHFYDQRDGGIGDIMDWCAKHRHESPWKKAAGVYVRVLSDPQLYIEGNHRTGALIMSYILVSAGQPPFVLTLENANAYFDPSTLIKNTRKGSFGMLFKVPKIKKRFAEFLQEQTDPIHLTDSPGSTPLRDSKRLSA
jgi:hypothetical protein